MRPPLRPGWHARRDGASREFDVIMQGTVFFDMVLTGLPALPSQGTELLAEGMGSCPGGIANLAVAASRLGLRTGLAAVFGDDVYGDFLWRTLAEQEGVDLSLSRRLADWHSPVTVSLAVQRDRAMVTHSHPSPVPASELLADVPPRRRPGWCTSARTPSRGWPGPRPAACGCSATSGWDPSRHWSPTRAGAAARSARLPAQQRRGDGLHPDRRSAGRADGAGRRGAGGGGDLRRPGLDRHRLRHRRGGMGAVAAGQRGRRDRRR